jgi:hypothetical protein
MLAGQQVEGRAMTDLVIVVSQGFRRALSRGAYRSGELPGLIEKATAEAVDEPEDDNDTQGETAT